MERRGPLISFSFALRPVQWSLMSNLERAYAPDIRIRIADAT
jgi:hypothetical protein